MIASAPGALDGPLSFVVKHGPLHVNVNDPLGPYGLYKNNAGNPNSHFVFALGLRKLVFGLLALLYRVRLT
jgi:hypothetical protein